MPQPLLNTAKAHFDQDLGRAEALLACAGSIPSESKGLAEDILRAAWMMAVGACDAFFSDAYADLIARTLRAKDLQPEVKLPDRLCKLKVPVIAVIRPSDSDGWRWRMAARGLIEEENVLSLEKIRELFNQFLTTKLLNKDTVEPWILHPQAKKRQLGCSLTEYINSTNNKEKERLRKEAVKRLEKRFGKIFQRRHDCIHNCDRPRVAPQKISGPATKKVLQDIRFLIERCHETLLCGYPLHLKELGFDGVTRNKVGAWEISTGLSSDTPGLPE